MGEEGNTIESLTKYFMWHLQNRSQQQHMELLNTYSAFMNSFKDETKYLDKAKVIVNYPIKFFIEYNPNFFTKEELKILDLNYRLAEIDFLYFRDTNFAKKLKTQYPTSQKSKRKYQTKLNLAQILIITSFIRGELFKDFIEIANKYNIAIPLVLPKVDSHDTGGVGIESTKSR